MVNQTNYTQGYSASTVSSHASRTVESDASFLLPYLRPTDRILDVGCGPGTITAGFCAHVPQGYVVGVDLSEDVLREARRLQQPRGGDGEAVAAATAAPAPAPGGALAFQRADLLQGLPFPDESFDVVYASQLFPHLNRPGSDDAARALTEMRRVVRRGGIVATRDATAQHFFPRHLNLEQLLTRNMLRGLGAEDWPGADMPALYRRVGFDVEGGGVRISCGTTCHADQRTRRWWADGLSGRLRDGDRFRQSWEDAGVSQGAIVDCVEALQRWAETEDAWYAILQCEIVAWKQEFSGDEPSTG